MRTHNILQDKENRKDILSMLSDLVLRLTLISSNYPCVEHIFMVPKVFEPLKFYCIWLNALKLFPRIEPPMPLKFLCSRGDSGPIKYDLDLNL